MKIMIDPGHGGYDVGAVGDIDGKNIFESNINLLIANVLCDKLKEKHQVSITRHDDTYVSMRDRVAYANNMEVSAFISIHCNAAVSHAAEGYEIWTSIGDTGADKLAVEIFEQFKIAFPDHKERTDCSDGDPDKESNFYVLENTLMPAVLVECEFITNEKQAKWLMKLDTWDKIADAIGAGLTKWEHK